MKKLVASLILVLCTGAYANGPHTRPHHDHSNRWVGPFIGGVITGVIIGRESSQPIPVPQPPILIPQTPPIYVPPPTPRYTTCLVPVFDPVTGTTRNEVIVCIR